MQTLLDQVASGQFSRRRFLSIAGASGLAATLSAATIDQAFAAGDTQTANQAKLEGAYDYIVVGAGASGAIIAGELSKTGAKVLVVESGGADTAPTIGNPSIWFHNVGGPLDWKLPITPVPQLNHRKLNMALGRVLGGGSSINAMVWSRGLERGYDAWERGGAKGWSFNDVLPTYKAQEDWEGGANQWRGSGGPVGGLAPTAERTVDPAKDDRGELDIRSRNYRSDPGIRGQNLPHAVQLQALRNQATLRGGMMIYALCSSLPFRLSIVVAASEPTAKTITPMP
jgi:choline dehydrogenase